jgi:hypothetical protein
MTFSAFRPGKNEGVFAIRPEIKNFIHIPPKTLRVFFYPSSRTTSQQNATLLPVENAQKKASTPVAMSLR